LWGVLARKGAFLNGEKACSPGREIYTKKSLVIVGRGESVSIPWTNRYTNNNGGGNDFPLRQKKRRGTRYSLLKKKRTEE